MKRYHVTSVVMILWAIWLGIYGPYPVQAQPAVADLTPLDSSHVTVTFSRAIYNRQTKQTAMTATVTNISSETIPGPIYLAIEGITPSTVTVVNAPTMSVEGTPLFVVEAASLPPGASRAPKLVFADPTRARFTMQHRVLFLGVTPIPVPDVVGMAEPAAQTALTNTGLTVGTVTSTHHATIAEGEVISQNPGAGTEVAPGTAVHLVVSLGPTPVSVPNVVGQSQATATTMLTTAGLTVGTVTSTHHATIAEGEVISQNPGAGTEVPPGTVVHLVVSLGPLVAVPDVAGLPQAAAEATLTGAGFTVGTITTTHSPSVLAGHVISHNPAASTEVVPGTAVNLVVSLGPDSISVPKVVGLSQAEAQTALSNAGLTMGTVTEVHNPAVPDGQVISQTPIAGTAVAPGSSVALVVSLGAEDPIPPTVAQIAPANGATDFPVNGRIIIRFSESLDPESVVTGAVRLFQDSTEVAGSVALSNDRLSITFTPAQDLIDLVEHTVQVQDVRDLAGNRMTDVFESTFTTANFADAVQPTILRTSPEHGASNVPVNAPYIVEFSERMDPASLTPERFTIYDNFTGQPISGLIQVDPEGRSAAFVPDVPYAVGRYHYVDLSGDITDAAGNRLNQFSGYSFDFTTAFTEDNERPHLVATSPGDGETNIPVNAQVMLTFSEPMNTVNVLRGIQVLADGVPVSGSLALSDGSRRVTFTSEVPLSPNTLHTVVTTTEITDLVGNPLDNPRSVTFETGDTVDNTTPQVVVMDPDNGVVEVPTNALVQLAFSERINLLTVTEATFQVLHGTTGLPIAGSVAVAADGLSATFTPSGGLADSTYYYVQAFITDLAGHTTGTGVFTDFATGETADTEPPQVVAVSPPDGTTEVPANARVMVRLSEPVSAVRVQHGAVVVSQSGIPVAGTVVLDFSRTILTFTPSAPLAGDTPYTMAVSGFTDLAGNAVVPFSSQFTTGLVGNNLVLATGVTTNVSSFFPGYPATNAIDGDLNTSWFTEIGDAANLGTSPFFEIVLPGDATVTELRMFGNREFADGFDFFAGIFQLFDVTGTELFNSGEVDLQAPDRDITLAIPNIAGVRRVRFTATADESDEPGFAELEVIGQFADPALGGFGDTQGPQVVSVQMIDGQIVITFDEVLDPTTITSDTLQIFHSDFGITVAGAYVVEGAVVTFLPATPLSATVLISVNGVQDLAGNGGSFFDTVPTGAGADTTPPTVVLVTPDDGATDIGPHAPVVLTFSESLEPSTIHSITFALFANGERLGASVSRTADNRTVTLSTTLPAGSVVTVVVTNNVQDLAGNRLADFESSFTTAVSVDGERPSVVSQRPGNGAIEVSLNASIVLYTSETLDITTIPDALFVSQNGTLVQGTTTVTSEGRAIEFVPDVPWAHGALIQVFLTSLAQDPAGNVLFDYQGSFQTVADPRTTAPVVVRTSTTNGISEVPRNVVIEVEFNEPLHPATVTTTTVRLVDGNTGEQIVSSVNLEHAGRVIRLVPNAPLAANTYYYYEPTTGIQDLDGQTLPSSYFFDFTTGDSEDTVSPHVVAVTPPDGTVDIGVNASIRVRLSEPINPLTVNDTTIRISDGSATVVACTISFSTNNRDVLLVPHAPLAAATRFDLTVNGIEDLAGNPVLPQTTQFTTGDEPDTVAPVVVQIDPFHGATEVPVNVVITFEVNEPIDPSTVGSNSFLVQDDATGELVAGSYTVSADGRTVSFVPEAPLTAGSSYSAYSSGCGPSQHILDLAGNPLTSGCSIFTSFTTGAATDTTGPQVVEVSPADGLVEVPINAQVVIAFDEPVQVYSVDQITLHDGAGEVEVIRQVSDGNRFLTLLPVVPLASNTTYTVIIAGVEDLAGNLLAAVETTFTTGTGADLIHPQVVAVDPASGAEEVPLNAVIQLTFSERINPLTVTEATSQVHDFTTGLPIAGSVTVAADGLSATFTPSSELAASTTYEVRVSSITDLAGHATGIVTYFTTETQ